MKITTFRAPLKLPYVSLWIDYMYIALLYNLHWHLIDAVLMTSLHDVMLC